MIMATTQREKEEKLLKSLKDPNEDHSSQISKLIDDTIKKGHKVYCATDWHLWTRLVKNKPACKKRKEFDKILKNINETLTKDDLLIYLGDLVDGEFQEKEELKSILLTLPGKKVMVLGNNDLFGPAFYKSCGFDYVVQSFVWDDVLFTHIPIRNSNHLNVHGHLHSNLYRPIYWIPYRNHIDVAWIGGREKPVELKDVLKKQKSYSKIIKEDPSHFEEGYNIQVGLFDMICGAWIPDPHDD